MTGTPDPDSIDSALDAAEFVASCEVDRVDQEMGRLRLSLRRSYDERYMLDIALTRTSRSGDQVHLYDADTNEDLYRE